MQSSCIAVGYTLHIHLCHFWQGSLMRRKSITYLQFENKGESSGLTYSKLFSSVPNRYVSFTD